MICAFGILHTITVLSINNNFGVLDFREIDNIDM
jgi:hypothetical protein